MEENIPYKSVRPHLGSLRDCGYYQVDSYKSELIKFIHKIYMRFILLFISTYTVQQIIKVYQVRFFLTVVLWLTVYEIFIDRIYFAYLNDLLVTPLPVRDDLNKVMETMYLMLTNSDALYKQVLFWKRQDKIEEILELLKSPLFDRNDPKHQVLLHSTARQAKVCLRGFNIASLFTCLLWVVHPLILHLQHKPIELAVWLPFDYNRNPQFYYAIVYQWVQTSWLAFGNTSMDTFITYMFAQCKTQLAILRLELENIVEKCTTEMKTSTESFSTIYNRNFKKIILHYNEIVTLANKTEKIFGNAILYFFLVSGWIMCTSAYRMIHIDPTSVGFLSMIFYIICILIEVYLYCYFGNEVAHESGKLMASAFGMDWHKIPVDCRYSLIIFMERIKRPIVPTAGSLIPLSNNTFVSILRSSYTFYTFLKNTD